MPYDEVKHYVDRLDSFGRDDIGHGLMHVKGLKRIGTPEAARALINHALPTEMIGIAVQTKAALVDMGQKDEKVIDMIIKEGLGHDEAQIQIDCAQVLGNIKNKRALLHLMKMTGNESNPLNTAVKEAIRKIQAANR